MRLFFLLLMFSCSMEPETTMMVIREKVDSSKNPLAAKMDNIVITKKELEKNIQVDIYELEEKIYKLKFDRLKSLLIEKLVKTHPDKKQLTNDEFLEKHILKDLIISEDDITKFAKSRSIPQAHLTEDITLRIKEFLTSQKKIKYIDRWLAQEGKNRGLVVYFKKPQRPIFPVTVEDSPYFGKKDARVTLVAYSDFQCPFSKKGVEIMKKIKDIYKGKVKIVHKNFPLPFHKDAKNMAMAALCAQEQGTSHFWDIYYKLYEDQTKGNKKYLKSLSGKLVGLNKEKFSKCLDHEKWKGRLNEEIKKGKELGVKSTPTFFVNGKIINGAHDFKVFKELIDEEMEKLN